MALAILFGHIGLCSFLSLFIIVERWIVLQSKYILSDSLLSDLTQGNFKVVNDNDASIAHTLTSFFQQSGKDSEKLKAFALLEISSMKEVFFFWKVLLELPL